MDKNKGVNGGNNEWAMVNGEWAIVEIFTIHHSPLFPAVYFFECKVHAVRPAKAIL
ncbi:MAG: hypothetical protein ABIN01_14890 [Ferruginibacter sp.]